ncbi:hypothetical protein ACTMTI_41530 [Nonomuraea sp. H19]|uniref:hypothetical protein n=1 Tax=Nonomuraea sp. H19 TaxID=3452206 RepID=UPI003F8926B8
MTGVHLRVERRKTGFREQPVHDSGRSDAPATTEGRKDAMSSHVLEPAAREIADATSKPPFLYELGPAGTRKVLDDLQATPVPMSDIDRSAR